MTSEYKSIARTFNAALPVVASQFTGLAFIFEVGCIQTNDNTSDISVVDLEGFCTQTTGLKRDNSVVQCVTWHPIIQGIICLRLGAHRREIIALTVR